MDEVTITVKKKWPDKSKYKYRNYIILTKAEGERFDDVIAQSECANASQLCKKIAQGKLLLVPSDGDREE